MTRTPQNERIVRIPTRFAATYLLRAERGWVLLDTGLPGSAPTIQRTLDRLGGGQSEALTLILLSHGHLDHAGGAAALQRLTHAPVAVHPGDADIIRAGSKRIPPAYGSWVNRLLRAMLCAAAFPILTQPVEPDILLRDGQRLDSFGLSARVIHTPGHTWGSSSLILDTGEAFIGDAVGMQAGLPRQNRLLIDPQAALVSLRTLADLPAHTVYPGHAGPFPARRLQHLLKEIEA